MMTAATMVPQQAAKIALPTLALVALAAICLLSPARAALAIGGMLAVIAIFRRPIITFVLLAFSVPWASGLTAGGGVPLSPTEVLSALIGIVWLTSCVRARRNPFLGAAWTPYILIFLVAICLSITQSTDLKASASEVLKWGELATVYVAGVALLRRRGDCAIVIAAVVAAGVSQALLGYLQLALSHGPAAFAAQRALLRAYGTFDQPNPYGGYLNMILPIALALALIGPPRWRAWSLVSALALAGAVLASESRGALLAGLGATAVVLAISSWRLRRLVGAAAVALIATGWLESFGIALGPFQRAVDALGFGGFTFDRVTDANFAQVERAAHWLAGVRMFAAHPFLGVGIGNYSAAYPSYHPRGWYNPLGHAHNYYINIAAEAGILGLVAYVLLAGSALWYSCAATLHARDPLFRAAGLGLTGALIATGLHNVFDVLYVHGTTALIGLLMAVASAAFLPNLEAAPAGSPAKD
jgi:O-antigen ligase